MKVGLKECYKDAQQQRIWWHKCRSSKALGPGFERVNKGMTYFCKYASHCKRINKW